MTTAVSRFTSFWAAFAMTVAASFRATGLAHAGIHAAQVVAVGRRRSNA
jgi:hypothetical protein